MNLMTRYAYNRRFGKSIGTAAAKIGAGVAAFGASATAAFAQSAIGAAALAETTGIKGDVNAVLLTTIVVVFLILAFLYLKRAAK